MFYGYLVYYLPFWYVWQQIANFVFDVSMVFVRLDALAKVSWQHLSRLLQTSAENHSFHNLYIFVAVEVAGVNFVSIARAVFFFALACVKKWPRKHEK
jgi:hypothetical protein